MATFVVLGYFTDQGIRNAKETTKRADAFKEMARKIGVTVKDVYWTLGPFDIVAVCEAPDDAHRIGARVQRRRLGQCPHPDAQGVLASRNRHHPRQHGLTEGLGAEVPAYAPSAEDREPRRQPWLAARHQPAGTRCPAACPLCGRMENKHVGVVT